MKLFNPSTIAPPNGSYSHGVLLQRPEELVFIAGQVAVAPDGTIPDALEDQAERVWENIGAILSDAGLKMSDLVKITSFLTRREDIGAFAKVRARHLGDHRPASTLLVVSALANPKFLVEVEAIAVRG